MISANPVFDRFSISPETSGLIVFGHQPMNAETKFESELDRIVRSELNIRINGLRKKPDIAAVNDILEAENRRIVECHQKGTIPQAIPGLFASFLQTRRNGRLAVPPETAEKDIQAAYLNKKGRFETLFTAAIMTIDSPRLIEILHEKQALFENKFSLASELLRLRETTKRIRTSANMTVSESPGIEEKAVSQLTGLAPLRADLQTIEVRCREFQEDDYLTEAVQGLLREVRQAEKSVSEKGRKAARFLFDKASELFHRYKTTPAELPSLDRFVACREELIRYAKIFGSTGDDDRRERIQGFIIVIDRTIENLTEEIEKQKKQEALIAERQQREIEEATNHFLEIKQMYANGALSLESQKKNAGDKLKRIRDTLAANSQRVMAREVERLIHSTGIGKPLPAKPAGDDFDYKKGFWILLPVSVCLLLIVFLFILL